MRSAADADKYRDMQLSWTHFPSLAPYVNKDALMGLLFSASWCDDCTNPRTGVPALVAFLQSTKDLPVVWVSSDYNREACQAFFESQMTGVAGYVPYESDDRTNLQRLFGVCAAKEREALGLTPEERLGGIPSLLIFDGATGRLVTRDGMDDIVGKEDAQAVLVKWKQQTEKSTK